MEDSDSSRESPPTGSGLVELPGGGSRSGSTPADFDQLREFVDIVPSASFDSGALHDDGTWQAQIRIDIDNRLAWNVVQEFGYVLNWVSVTEPLPTRFYPRSAPPYMNGGPKQFLHWIIDGHDPDFSPDHAAGWLEGRLPRPVNDLEQWQLADED